MKKKILALVMTFIVPGIHSAMANTGTVTFGGELTANTCNVSVDGGNSSNTVTLPKISQSVLDSAGKTAGRTPFTMELSGCSGALKTAAAFFEQGPGVTNTGFLINTGGTAGNSVYLQLRDGSNSDAIIKVGDRSQLTNTKFLDISSGGATLLYSAEYRAASNTVSAGTVVAAVNYNIQYK